MATITVTLPEGITLSQGKQISFTAPCDSTGVTGIIINNVTYTLLKANGDSLETGAFISGALISVLIDLTNHKAYIQNNAEVNVQSDWNATEGDALILNKPSTYTPSSHTHGNLTNDGKIGSTADLFVVTGTAGEVTTKTVADTKTLLGIADGVYNKLLDVTVGTAATSVSLDISGIDITQYTKLIVRPFLKTATTGDFATVSIRANNISTDYYSKLSSATSAGSATSFGYIKTGGYLCGAADIELSLKPVTTGELLIMCATKYVGFGEAGSVIAIEDMIGMLKVEISTTLTSINFISTKNIAVGSTFTVYGVKK